MTTCQGILSGALALPDVALEDTQRSSSHKASYHVEEDTGYIRSSAFLLQDLGGSH